MELVLLKVVHVLAAVTAVGANLTYAVWLRAAGSDRDRLGFTIAGIRRLERRVANPAYIVLAVTGVLMVALGMYSFTTAWIALSIVLYVALALIGSLVFAPAMTRLADEADRDPTSPGFTAAARRANTLGVVATVIAVIIIVLMVAKPT